MRPQPLIAVSDGEASSRWCRRPPGCASGHGGDSLILQLHRFEADHRHAPIGDPAGRSYGDGVLLWFEVDDFDAAMGRIAEPGTDVVRPRHRNPNARPWECWLRDPDGCTAASANPDGTA